MSDLDFTCYNTGLKSKFERKIVKTPQWISKNNSTSLKSPEDGGFCPKASSAL